jgi:exosome complex RNA-binding protein Rrp4
VLQLTKKGEEKLKLKEDNLQILKKGVVVAVPSLFTRGIGS